MTRKIIFKKFKERGVRILTGFQLLRISERGAYVLDKDGKELLLEGDSIIIAVGNRPDNSLFNQIKDMGIEAYQIGDCLEVRSAKEAILEGASIGRLI
jgi:2,4-dienoyl-CoA reductase (NADPH2)